MASEFYTEYYIDKGDRKIGPFDAMSMVRKIRNGKVTPHTVVYVGEAYTGVRAGELPEFEVFFNPPDVASDVPMQSIDGPLDVGEMLRDAWAHFSDNQLLSLMAGALMVCGIIAGLVLSTLMPPVLLAVVISFMIGLLWFIFLIYVGRTVDGQDADGAFWKDLATNHAAKVLGAAAVAAMLPLGIPLMIAVLVPEIGYPLLVGGIALFALHIFAPLFIIHNPTLSFMEALTMSRAWVTQQSTGNMLVIIGLVAINAVATLAFLIPVFVTLPVTSVALADLFMQRINRPDI